MVTTFDSLLMNSQNALFQSVSAGPVVCKCQTQSDQNPEEGEAKASNEAKNQCLLLVKYLASTYLNKFLTIKLVSLIPNNQNVL